MHIRIKTQYFRRYREYVSLTDIPDHVRQAVIVSEDKEFYTHPGFSLRAIAAAMVANIKSRDLAFGGSTITQQLIKNTLLTPEVSISRKIKEWI